VHTEVLNLPRFADIMDQCGSSGFLQIEDYGLVGDMHTCALVGKNGSLDFMCWPNFDSPSLFCRMLDRNGGHWSIRPLFAQDDRTAPISKQQYVASSNLLYTKWIHESGVVDLTDFFALSSHGDQITTYGKHIPAAQKHASSPTLIRKVECVRGEMDVHVEIDPRPDYARGTHLFYPTKVRQVDEVNLCQSVIFEHQGDGLPAVHAMFEKTEGNAHGIFQTLDTGGVSADLHLVEGQVVYFLMATDHAINSNATQDTDGDAEAVSNQALEMIKSASYHEVQTKNYWKNWARKCRYRGRFQQEVERSLLLLKLLTYKPSGAIIAAPTFSLPEAIGGSRNWDYRYSWVRDSSFTVYVFLKMGFVDEAEAFINFIFDRIQDWHQEGADKPLPLMFSITGENDLPELILEHLGGYKDTRPVRIGNAATGHIQLDIYGELMDAIYLYNKHGKPITYDQWVSIRHLINYVSTVWSQPDMSIWEVRGKKEHFVYSKVMLWVAFDRALRLAEKRCLPCPDRNEWLVTRDTIYEQVMTEGYSSGWPVFCLLSNNCQIR
jgi:GH15 family glucan-1,4-alpha-glucosidase